jgi:sodium/potassium-transporting ATPase subunit alpha
MATREEALEKLDETIQADKERSSVEITAAFQEQKAKMAEIAAAKKEAKKEGKELDLRADLQMTEHSCDLDELLEELGTDRKTGLSKQQVKDKQEKEGFNRLSPPYEKPEWLKLLETQKGFFNILLWAGATLCFIGYGLNESVDNLYLGIVLSFVVTVTGIFEYFQEKKSNDLMNSFKNMLPPEVQVLREGQWDTVEAHDICRGDIVKVVAGNKIPADFRVIECTDDMKVEQSALTGEPDALSRNANMSTETNPLEAKNLCFFGTLCPQGSAKGIIVNIGDSTVMGRIKTIATQTENVQTPINREIERFVKIVSSVAVFLGVTFFIIGAIKETDFITNLVFMIGIIVANVPEGLLATVTVCLSLTAQRMFYKNVLVKNLESVETLGSTSCICSDKTGTLTINKMTVANVCVDTTIYETHYCRTKADLPELDVTKDSARRLIRCGTCCNNATFPASGRRASEDDPKGAYKKGDALPFRSIIMKGGVEDSVINWVTDGDASESAMIKFTQDQGMYNDAAVEASKAAGLDEVGIMGARAAYPKVKIENKGQTRSWEIPFNSKNKYQVSVHKQPGDAKKALLLMKGAPERILDRCAYVWHEGERVELTEDMKQKYNDLNLDLAKMGRRVLAFCEQELDEAKYPANWDGFSTDPPNFPLGESEEVVNEKLAQQKEGDKPVAYKQTCEKLTYIGMMALIDPPRRQVPGAVDKCKSAGIKVVMVTGDHPATAHAIAKEVNIIWGNTKEEQEEENMKKYGNKIGKDGKDNPEYAPAKVVPGWTFTHLTPQEWWDATCSKQQIVFARTSPQQKLIIVENFQKRGQVVAVTGDGVNDAPALKKADIGVAMGIMGSEVSKDAADMILLDDNFASIVSGVEEGRLIFDNLKKSIAYTLSSNIPEISPFLAFITVNIPLPLSTILILCVDLGTDMVPAISMAWENAEADIMKRRPRDAQNDHLVTMRLVCFAYLQIGVVQASAGFYAWMTILSDYGYQPKTLPGLGAFDNWGKQLMYCKVKNGVLRDIDGKYATTPYEEMKPGEVNKWFSKGYFFWDDDITVLDDPSKSLSGFDYGTIDSCHFPSKNFVGQSSTEFTWTKKDNWPQNNKEIETTGKRRVITTNQMLALREAGYIPYIPFRGRMSPFFKKGWLNWEVSVQGEGLGVPGMGETRQLNYHFQSQPIGYYTIKSGAEKYQRSEWFAHVTTASFTAADVNEFKVAGLKMGSEVYKDKTSFFLPGRNSSESTKLFTNFPIADEDIEQSDVPKASHQTVNKLHSWVQDGKIYQNVASRQMQSEALAHAQCGGFICIIVVQWADLMICKTRWLSIRHQGMKNHIMNFGLLFETCLGAFLCYTPGLGDVLGTRPLRLLHWTPGMPFCLLIFLYDETRKKIMRDSSQTITDKVSGENFKKAGWMERMTYY